MFQMREKRKPLNAPTKSEGAKVPPQPPAPFVAEVAITLVSTTSPTKMMSSWPCP